MPGQQDSPLPGGEPAAFAFDFETLYDMVEWRFDGEVRTWRMGVKRMPGGRLMLKAQKGKAGLAAESVIVEDLDWDVAAAELAPKLARRGLLP